MTALQVLKELKKEKYPELKTGEYNLPLILAAMHRFAELRQCNISGALPLVERGLLDEAIGDVIVISSLNEYYVAKKLISEQFVVINKEDLGGNDR